MGRLILKPLRPEAGLPAELSVYSGTTRTLGRGADNDFKVDWPSLGYRHAQLTYAADADECSIRWHPNLSVDAMGIFVDGVEVQNKPYPIQAGARVFVGGLHTLASYEGVAP